MLSLKETATWDERRILIRDELASVAAGPRSLVSVTLTGGSKATGRNPRLVTLIEPLPRNAQGEYPPDTMALAFDPPSGADYYHWVRLRAIEDISV